MFRVLRVCTSSQSFRFCERSCVAVVSNDAHTRLWCLRSLGDGPARSAFYCICCWEAQSGTLLHPKYGMFRGYTFWCLRRLFIVNGCSLPAFLFCYLLVSCLTVLPQVQRILDGDQFWAGKNSERRGTNEQYHII